MIVYVNIVWRVKMKKTNLSDGEKTALFLMGLVNPDLYPDKKKVFSIELEDKDGTSNHDFTLIGLIGFINLAFHILEHEYANIIKKESAN